MFKLQNWRLFLQVPFKMEYEIPWDYISQTHKAQLHSALPMWCRWIIFCNMTSWATESTHNIKGDTRLEKHERAGSLKQPLRELTLAWKCKRFKRFRYGVQGEVIQKSRWRLEKQGYSALYWAMAISVTFLKTELLRSWTTEYPHRALTLGTC